ncbi:MAG: hypothetical protein QOG35_1446 [Solirubrobacteraceae bacterium]|nr:hypothetical protein [Solirubrobacteraceae bacterium]
MLAREAPVAFGVFYRRHVLAVHGYFRRRRPRIHDADLSHNVEAGGLVRTTVDLYDHRRGAYRIVVRYRTVRRRPGPCAIPAYPGLLVGRTRVHVR